MTLEEKVIKAQKGDDNAFYELISQNKEMLYKTAFTYVKNKEDALDVFHETVYKAYISIDKLKEPEFFNTWLVRILINCSLDLLKKNKKNQLAYEEEIKYTKESNADMESEIDLHNAIDKLEDKYKTIVILKYFQGMTLKEISEVLECPLSTVKTNLYKALKQLKIQIEEVDYFG